MGATLIQHSWKAVFSSLKSLDEARFSSAGGQLTALNGSVMLNKIGMVIARENRAQLC
jgi:hypothetical protein